MKKDKIQIEEIIVVEGKDDTKRIQEVVIADTIETNGSAINQETLEKISHAQTIRGVIIFTDPDFSGEKIRKQVQEAVPQAKHAFINRKNSVPKKKGGSLGVEHASDEVILDALRLVSTPTTEVYQSDIPTDYLIYSGLIAGKHARKRREQLGDILRIGYTNGKQLRKRLDMFQIDLSTLQDALTQVIMEEKNDGLS
ncbi:ribonuclease M5 [Vagococcus penaei]|uniref:Ribonuclease M5 n=1 Tax=Vagococcus penaei TaxID=633807 RepID=A0A1Q2D5H8_9ENTE|nr:ribonuclease M5 [Vagococcus penaei]AQP53541.1 ribonuclease M5 [Vagococcus penaei]RSU07484.1 ribonuclease M5 [Vagococcus penaei]